MSREMARSIQMLLLLPLIGVLLVTLVLLYMTQQSLNQRLAKPAKRSSKTWW